MIHFVHARITMTQTRQPHQDIRIEQDQGVLALHLNRPEVHNALRTDMLREIADTLATAANDDRIGCVVITGNQRVFAAGADVAEMARLSMTEMLADPRPELWRRIQLFPKPLIAAVNGHALGGGCELALHCDLIIAGRNAHFGQPEIKLGIIPGAGGIQRLARRVGRSLTSQMVFTGEPITAATALRAGLVSELCEPELTLERAQTLARTIAGRPPLAVLQAKQALLLAEEMPLSAALEFERKAFVLLAGTEDRNEGLAAFLEKRPPRFKGR